MQVRGRQYFRKLLNLGLMVCSVPIQNLSSYPIWKKVSRWAHQAVLYISLIHSIARVFSLCCTVEEGSTDSPFRIREVFPIHKQCVNTFVWKRHCYLRHISSCLSQQQLLPHPPHWIERGSSLYLQNWCGRQNSQWCQRDGEEPLWVQLGSAHFPKMGLTSLNMSFKPATLTAVETMASVSSSLVNTKLPLSRTEQ